MIPGRRRLLLVGALGAVALLGFVAYLATRTEPRPSGSDNDNDNVEVDVDVNLNVNATVDAGVDAHVAAHMPDAATITAPPSESLLQTAANFKAVTDRLTRSPNKWLVSSAKKALSQARTISDLLRTNQLTDREAVLQLRDLEYTLRREAEAAGESP